MSNWKEYSLGQISEILIGGTPSRNVDKYWAKENENGYKWVAISDLKNHKFIDNTAEKITELGYRSSNTKLIPPGTVIFSFKLSIGKKAITKVELLTNEAIAGFITDKHLIDDIFLYYYLDVIDYSRVTDSAIKGITLNKQKLNILKLTLPPIPIQQKIAKILSTIDGQIEKTEAIIAKYQAVKQGMLQDLFTRGIDVTTGKLRPKYEDAPELYKDSPLGMIPMEWEVLDLATMTKLITDGSHFSPIPQENGELIGNVKDMKDWGLDFESMTRISKEEYDLLSKQNCSPEINDVLLSKDGTIGKVWVYKYKRKIVLLSSIAIIKPKEKIIADFLGELLKSFYFDKHLYMFQSGSALKRLVLSDIKKMTFPIPHNITEQKIIAKLLESVEQNIRLHSAELNKLIQIKQGLMSDLLSGRVEVTA
jgi:type I restriction enzyme, S subunit